MDHLRNSSGFCPSSLWNSKPIGRSFHLGLFPHGQLLPQLILEDKVFRSAIRSQTNGGHQSQVKFIGTLISDDETRQLTYVIDRFVFADSKATEISNHQPLAGEFIVPVLCNNASVNGLVQDGTKDIETYCHSSSSIELHRFLYLCGQMSSIHQTSADADLSFHLVTIKNSFTLTPIDADHIQILPTALLKRLSSPTKSSFDLNQSHFGYCSLDRSSKNKILLILENDPQACSLPLVGIWVSGIADVECAFVWASCVRYCMNSLLKQRLCPGSDSQQSFLLACCLASSHHEWIFYEVCAVETNSTVPMIIDFDLWASTKKIIIPNSTSHSYDRNSSTQIPYDFEFKRIHDLSESSHAPEAASAHSLFPIRSIYKGHLPMSPSNALPIVVSDTNNDHCHQVSPSSSKNNGSLFGIPRQPPKQCLEPSPSWNCFSTVSVNSPKHLERLATANLQLQTTASVSSSTTISDIQWKEELIERMQSYDVHIQSLTALVAQLLETQKQQLQQSIMISPSKEAAKRDVAVQSEPSSPYAHDATDSPSSLVNNNWHKLLSPKVENSQLKTSSVASTEAKPLVQFQTRSTSSFGRQHSPIIANSSHFSPKRPIRSISPTRRSIPTDLNPVDILKPIFQFIDSQQQKQQQQQLQQDGIASSVLTAHNSIDTVSMKSNDKETDYEHESVLHTINPSQQQQHVTSTRTTGISVFSNGVQMQFINQRSSTTTLYPQSSVAVTSSLSGDLLVTSPQKSENNLSIEVHGLEMKYLDDDQLAVAIECDRQSQKSLNTLPQTSQVVDKSLSFETQEYLQRYGLFTDAHN